MDQEKTMRRAGGWCITMGIITLTVGITVGVGCLVAGGDLLKHS